MATKEPDYRTLNDELEAILARLQSGDITIDEALPAYEQGMKLIKQLEQHLKTAENRVTELQAQQEA